MAASENRDRAQLHAKLRPALRRGSCTHSQSQQAARLALLESGLPPLTPPIMRAAHHGRVSGWMRNMTAIVTNPINSLAHRIGRWHRDFHLLLQLVLVLRYLRELGFFLFLLYLALLCLLFLRIERLFQPCATHFAGDYSFAVGVVFVFLEQSPVSLRSRVAPRRNCSYRTSSHSSVSPSG